MEWDESEALVESYLAEIEGASGASTTAASGAPTSAAPAIHDAVTQDDVDYLKALIKSGEDVNSEVQGFTVRVCWQFGRGFGWAK